MSIQYFQFVYFGKSETIEENLIDFTFRLIVLCQGRIKNTFQKLCYHEFSFRKQVLNLMRKGISLSHRNALTKCFYYR